MTAQSQPEENSQPTDQELAASWLENGDHFLRAMVNVVNGQDTEIPVTLTVGGLLITGRLASGHKYFQQFGEKLGESFNEEGRDELAKAMAERAAIYTKEPDERQLGPTYIHVRGVRYYLPTPQRGIPSDTDDSTWWRGRIESVDGWMLGQLTEGPAQDV